MVPVQLTVQGVQCGPPRNDFLSHFSQYDMGVKIPTTLGYNMSREGCKWKYI